MKHNITILLLMIAALSMSVVMGAGSAQASATVSQADEPDAAQVQLLVDYFLLPRVLAISQCLSIFSMRASLLTREIVNPIPR